MDTKKVLKRFSNILFRTKRECSGINYWMKRSRQYNRRAVLDIRHSEEEFDIVTQMQKETIFPFLKQCLKGNERFILDFGCGPGRFTPDLANIIQGKAIGVDPIKYLIDLAPKNEDVEYRLMKEGVIPVEDRSIDVVWICLVLVVIVSDNVLRRTITEIHRIMKKDGLIFLVECTSDKKPREYLKFRSIETYQTLFSFVELKHLADYFDIDQRISIMAGRRG